MSCKQSADARQFKIFATFLHKRAYSKEALAELTGFQYTTICRWLATLHCGPDNLVYIERWERSATVGPFTAYWKWGHRMPDAIKPAKISREEKNRRLRVKNAITKTTTGIIYHVN